MVVVLRWQGASKTTPTTRDQSPILSRKFNQRLADPMARENRTLSRSKEVCSTILKIPSSGNVHSLIILPCFGRSSLSFSLSFPLLFPIDFPLSIEGSFCLPRPRTVPELRPDTGRAISMPSDQTPKTSGASSTRSSSSFVDPKFPSCSLPFNSPFEFCGLSFWEKRPRRHDSPTCTFFGKGTSRGL